MLKDSKTELKIGSNFKDVSDPELASLQNILKNVGIEFSKAANGMAPQQEHKAVPGFDFSQN